MQKKKRGWINSLCDGGDGGDELIFVTCLSGLHFQVGDDVCEEFQQVW